MMLNEKVDVEKILKETSKSISNGHTIAQLEEFEKLLKKVDKRGKRNLRYAIRILQEVIKLKKKKSKKILTRTCIFMFMNIFFLTLVTAQFGYDNPNLPRVDPPEAEVVSANLSNISHNNLLGLQGGISPNEYYHLNQSIFSYLMSNIYDWLTSVTSPFDQSLNTTDDVIFNSVNVTDSLNVTGNAWFGSNVTIVGNLSGGSPVKIVGGVNISGDANVNGSLFADFIDAAFSWIIGPDSVDWLIFNTTQLDYNESLLNQTIENKIAENVTLKWQETGSTLHPINSSLNVGIGTSNAIDKLSLVGDFNQTGGNSTLNLIYGEMFNRDDDGTTITLNTIDVFENITNLSSGSLNGVSFNDNTLIISFDGVYRVGYSISATSAANSKYALALAVNDVVIDKTVAERTISAGGSLANMGTLAELSLNSGDTINLQVADLNQPAQNIAYVAVNANIVRIGN